jgi:hypothetical protein
MMVAIWILSLISVAEFVASPINFWTGRAQNLQFFYQFTGWGTATAQRVWGPLQLAGAVLIAAGILNPVIGIVGASLIFTICSIYLVRLAAPGRRARSGIGAYAFFGACAAALLIVQILRLSS